MRNGYFDADMDAGDDYLDLGICSGQGLGFLAWIWNFYSAESIEPKPNKPTRSTFHQFCIHALSSFYIHLYIYIHTSHRPIHPNVIEPTSQPTKHSVVFTLTGLLFDTHLQSKAFVDMESTFFALMSQLQEGHCRSEESALAFTAIVWI